MCNIDGEGRVVLNWEKMKYTYNVYENGERGKKYTNLVWGDGKCD